MHISSGCRPRSTYIPSTRNMLDIVLGAQAWGDVAEVHLFGDYLNLHGHSIAARGERRAREGKGKGRHKRTWKPVERREKDKNIRGQRRGEEKSRGEEVTIAGRVRKERAEGSSEVHLGKIKHGCKYVFVLDVFAISCWAVKLSEMVNLAYVAIWIVKDIFPAKESSIYFLEHAHKNTTYKQLSLLKSTQGTPGNVINTHWQVTVLLFNDRLHCESTPACLSKTRPHTHTYTRLTHSSVVLIQWLSGLRRVLKQVEQFHFTVIQPLKPGEDSTYDTVCHCYDITIS